MKTKPENPRGLPVVGPWDVLDAATRGEEWVTFGELKRAREQLATDLAAAIARAEAAEALAKAIGAEYNALILHMDSGGDFYEFQAAIAAQQAEGE